MLNFTELETWLDPKQFHFLEYGNRLYFKKVSIDLWINEKEAQNIKNSKICEAKIIPLEREVF